VLADGSVLREHNSSEFNLLQQDLLDRLHQEKFERLGRLLPIRQSRAPILKIFLYLNKELGCNGVLL
jgi:hypothetical protein